MDASLATHRSRENAFQLALQQINSEQGQDGIKFGALFCTIEEDSQLDELTRSEAAKSTSDFLTQELELVALFGPSASDDVLAIAESVIERKVLLLSPAASSPTLASVELSGGDQAPGLVWSVASSDALQGKAIALDMTNPGSGRTSAALKVAVVYDEGSYGTALTDVFQSEFESLGGSISRFPYATSAQQAEKTAEASVGDFEEVLFVSAQSSAVVAFLNSAAELEGFATKAIFLTDSAANADVLSLANPSRFPSVRGTRPASGDTNNIVFANFVSAYAGEFNEDVSQLSFVSHSYDSAWLLAAATQWSSYNHEETTGITIAQGLRALSQGTVLGLRPSSWQSIKEGLQVQGSVNLEGASGQLDFDPDTEETSGLVETWRIEEGHILPIELWE